MTAATAVDLAAIPLFASLSKDELQATAQLRQSQVGLALLMDVVARLRRLLWHRTSHVQGTGIRGAWRHWLAGVLHECRDATPDDRSPLGSNCVGDQVAEITPHLLALGLEPVGSTPDELASRIAEDVARWAPIVKASGFRDDE